MNSYPVICVGKEFRFEAAHALEDYDGPCRNIHGHSYTLKVVVSGKPCADKACGTPGLVIDFGILKQIVQEHVISKFDHKLLLFEKSEHLKSTVLAGTDVVRLPFNPTCEMLLISIRNELEQNLPTQIRLESVELHETATSFAYWSRHNNTGEK